MLSIRTLSRAIPFINYFSSFSRTSNFNQSIFTGAAHASPSRSLSILKLNPEHDRTTHFLSRSKLVGFGSERNFSTKSNSDSNIGSSGHLQSIRREFLRDTLSREQLEPNPLDQFRKWFKEAMQDGVKDPNAMALATASPDAKPSCRIVYMKKIDESGLYFFTNYNSRKGQELSDNPYATVVFYWNERQVIIEGRVSRVEKAESEAYFHSRPREAQLASRASQQGQIIPSRETLEAAYANLNEIYRDREIDLGESWGGFCIDLDRVEIWQGGEHRLHDRFQYMKIREGEWKIERISP